MSNTDLREQLQSIYDARGVLTPAIVVDEAKPKNHPLHGHFEWNNKTAGEAWRRHQAHELIRSVRIKYAAPDGKLSDVRAFHAVRSEEVGNGGYKYEPADHIAQDPMMREIVLRDMEREWRQLQSRYGHFKEFVDLVRREVEAA